MPTGLAKKMGADELVCVDLEGVGITRPNLTGLPTTMVRSYWELGDILHFDPDTARRNIELGYYDTAALWDICGGVPMLSPVMPRAARTLLRSTQNLSGCKRPCGRNTRSP